MTTQLPPRLKCGEVYTWNCIGEAYAIECGLCEERPLCTLAEFAEHMEIWHSSWEEEEQEVEEEKDNEKDEDEDKDEKDQDEEKNENEYDHEALTFQLEDHNLDRQTMLDGNYYDAMLDESDVMNLPMDLELKMPKQQLQLDFLELENPESSLAAMLEPFEQVLIADDEAEADSIIVSNNNDDDDEKEIHDDGASIVKDCTEDVSLSDTEPEPTALNLQNQIQFGLDEPYTSAKLSKEHIEHLIDLYQEHPRVWNQSHPEYSETQLSRQSWQEITQKWSQYCGKSFSTTDVRIRVSTLCQRYLKERERLENEGEVDAIGKFVHFDKLQFLDEQQTLKTRRLIFEQQNAKLLEIYKHFPLLWHNHQKNIKRPDERAKSLRSISTALELCGIYLSAFSVQRRLKALRKCYRLEKIRFLHCKVEGRTFETSFKHYAEMEFLHKHLDPYVCAICGKIFENLLGYREHINNESHGGWSAEEESDREEDDNAIEEEVWQEKQQEQEEQQEQQELSNEMDTSTEREAVSVNFNLFFTDVISAPVDQDNSTEDFMQVAKVAVENNSNQLSEIIEEISSKSVSEEKSIESVTDVQSSEFQLLTPIVEEMPKTLVATVECASFSYDLNLNASKENTTDSTAMTPTKIDDLQDSSIDNPQSFARLTVEQTHKLITLYKLQPQLWDPNHLDYHSRKHRRVAWRLLTTKLNKLYKMHYVWKTLHRKLTDYAKYYRREKNRIEAERSCTKWCFFDDFAFLDDVIVINTELQKSLQHKDNNLKIIEIYKTHPQLWDTHHAEYTKRKMRQRYIESMCSKLQEECNLQITPERLKQRLLDFRCQYRQAKEQRIAALQCNETFTPAYDFYEELQYLELHVSPFLCGLCGASFKRHTDFVVHERRLHSSTSHSGGGRSQRTSNTAAESALENVCHICGMTFTLRSNLVCHLQRHMNERTYACTLCPKRFFNSTALRVHERSHTKNYPCVCELCGRKFVNASKLNQHTKRHRNQRDFPCDRCDKAFYSAFERERHLRRHLQIRDKVCEICGKAFVVGSAYYAHKMIHSDVKKYECVQCNVRFAQYAGLYKHRKKFHP